MTDKLNKIFSKTECPSEDVLQKYLKDELSKEEKHLVEKHLIDCEICSDVLEGMSLLSDSKTAAPIFAEISSDIKSIINKPKTKTRIIKLNSWIPYVAAAAVILFIVSIFYLRQDLSDNKIIVAEKVKETIEKEIESKQPINNENNELVEKPEGAHQENTKVLELELQEDIDLDFTANDVPEKVVANYENPPEAITKSLSGSTAVGEATVTYSFTPPEAAYQPQKEISNATRIQTEEISVKNTDAETVQLNEVQVVNTQSKKQVFGNKKYSKKKRYSKKKTTKSKQRSISCPSFGEEKKEAKKPEVKDDIIIANNETTTPFDTTKNNYLWDDQTNIYKQALNNYNSKKYSTAIALFNLVLTDSINHYNSLYYGGISYYKLNKNDSALIYLNKVLEIEKGKFQQEAMWHKALILKRTNKISETKLILQSIINENGKYKIQAKDLLKQLN